MLLDFMATELVSLIILRFISFLGYAPLLFKFVTLGFQGLDLALDLLISFLFELD